MDQAVLEKTLAQVLSQNMDTIKKDLEGVVVEKIDSKVKELNLDKIDLKHSMFPGVYGGDDEKASKYKRISAFMKSVFKKDADLVTKAMTEGQDSAGGFLVPEEMAAEVARIANDYGLARKLGRVLPMGSDTLNVPVESSSVTVYFPGEAANGTESSPGLGNVPLIAKSMVGITVASNEFLKDAKVDVVKYLLELFAEEFAGTEDNQAFNGTGSPFLGILQDSGVTVRTMASGQDTFAETKVSDLLGLVSDVKTTVLPTSAFFMHRAVWAAIKGIQENSQSVLAIQNQGQVLQYVGPDGVKQLQPHGWLLGFPVFLTDKLVGTTAVSTKFVVFGSMAKGLFFGDRQEMAMDISKEATISSTNLFQSNQSAVRLIQRVAIKVGLPTAFSVLKTAAS